MKLSNRTWILLGLVLATAVSAILQYVSQGLLATGHSASYFSEWFWRFEGALWGLRALVDACVVANLFATRARSRTESYVISFFEVALLAIIAVTLGPTIASMGYNVAVKDALPTWAFWTWNFCIAAYAPLMMGAAGYAYKCRDTTKEVPKEVPQKNDLEQKIVEILKDGDLKPGEIAKRTGAKPWQVSRAVARLVDNGVASKNGTVSLIAVSRRV